jgi:hypothetical protein
LYLGFVCGSGPYHAFDGNKSNSFTSQSQVKNQFTFSRVSPHTDARLIKTVTRPPPHCSAVAKYNSLTHVSI